MSESNLLLSKGCCASLVSSHSSFMLVFPVQSCCVPSCVISLVTEEAQITGNPCLQSFYLKKTAITCHVKSMILQSLWKSFTWKLTLQLIAVEQFLECLSGNNLKIGQEEIKGRNSSPRSIWFLSFSYFHLKQHCF